MSAEATGWVYRCSPYRGVPFTIHLAIADSVNDQNNYEFWMRQGVLAAKARTTRGTVNTAIEQMVADELLVLVERGSGGANRYRMAMPEGAATVYEVRAQTTPQGARPARKGARPDDTRVRDQRAGGARPARTEPKGTQGATQGDQTLPLNADGDAAAAGFDAFWAIWPRKVDKHRARQAWAKAVRLVPVDTIVAAAERYAAEVAGREPRHVSHATSWLNGRRWEDQPGANRDRQPPGGSTDGHDRGAAAGRVQL